MHIWIVNPNTTKSMTERIGSVARSFASVGTKITAVNPAMGPASMVRSPLTVGIFLVLAGYYLYYYGWVLWKSKHLKTEDIEVASAAATQ